MAAPGSFANPESLTILSDAVNQILIDTARFFKTSGSLHSRAQLRTSSPASCERFQIALDNLSEQIFIAKAFLEKDYESITAKNAAPKVEPTDNHAPAEDITMSDAPPTTVDQPVNNVVEKSTPPEPPIKAEMPEAIPAHHNTEAEKEKPVASEGVETTKQDENTTSEQAPPVTTGDDMNFDSMVSTDGANANEFDLNFNFGNDEIGNQNFLDGTNFLASGTSMAEGASNEHGAGSISSLLPGLESYAVDKNAGNDFNLELQKLREQSNANGQAGGQSNIGQDDMLAPGESSFDDLFLEKDNLEGDENLLGGDGLMELGELDDNWFN